MPSYSFRGEPLSPGQLVERWVPFAIKFAWFHERNYHPHEYQAIFHTMCLDDNQADRLCRYRHLVAGRRGGKTLSAAWEVLFYVMNPEVFHWDAHHKESDEPLHVWVLTKDHKVGRAPLKAFRQVLKEAGFRNNVEYKENRSEAYFDFQNGSLVEFKTAVDPQSLRGAGLDIMWIDEAAFITNSEAYDVARPALSDKIGIVVCTTTPDGKNWYYDKWWSDEALADPNVGRVEYRSIDNPYFEREEWEEVKRIFHPMLFKQEFEASFDSMVGKELPGEWLTKHFYTMSELPRNDDNKIELDRYIGIDLASSLADTADYFVAALLGVTKDLTEVFLLELYKDRIPFADQLDLVREWHLKYRPMLIGIENTGYQQVLVQQTLRLENLPPVVPQPAQGKKSVRILSMSPLFKIGRVRVRADHRDFIEEWLNYDSQLKNPKDDCLDAVEIALRTAGALLPLSALDERTITPNTLMDDARDDLPGIWTPNSDHFDEHMGSDW